MSHDTTDPLIGTTIAQYRILSLIGGGGMGVVYRAEDRKLGRAVALKFLPPELGHNPEAKDRFFQEARAAAGLDHPNICTIFEFGETAEGLGLVKILDFGLAKVMGQSDLTRTGSSMGTPAYMSPEHARGEKVDPRTDLWSLGVLLYECLAGKAPFTGPSIPAVIFSIFSSEPESIRELRPEVPEGLAGILAKLLRKDPGERYGSCRDVLYDLERVPLPPPEEPSPRKVPDTRPITPSMASEVREDIAREKAEAPSADDTATLGVTPPPDELDQLLARGLEAALARDYARAAEIFEKAVELHPADTRAKFNLERVRKRLKARGR